MEDITREKKMIQASLFPQLQEPFPRLDISLLYKIRYVHPKTGLVLKESFYLEGGKRIAGRAQYLYNSEWVYKEELPVERQNRSARESSLKFFMSFSPVIFSIGFLLYASRSWKRPSTSCTSSLCSLP